MNLKTNNIFSKGKLYALCGIDAKGFIRKKVSEDQWLCPGAIYLPEKTPAGNILFFEAIFPSFSAEKAKKYLKALEVRDLSSQSAVVLALIALYLAIEGPSLCLGELVHLLSEKDRKKVQNILFEDLSLSRRFIVLEEDSFETFSASCDGVLAVKGEDLLFSFECADYPSLFCQIETPESELSIPSDKLLGERKMGRVRELDLAMTPEEAARCLKGLSYSLHPLPFSTFLEDFQGYYPKGENDEN